MIKQKMSELWGAISGRESPMVAELRESELRFRQVAEHINEVFFLCDPEFTHMYYISPGYEEIWGRSCESLYANPRSFMDSIHVDDRERAIHAIAPQGQAASNTLEYRIVRPDGGIRWIGNRAFPVRNESGEIYRVTGIAEDITERKQALDRLVRQTQALERSNRRLFLLGEMTGLLQTVVRIEEVAAIVQGYLAQIHVGTSGALYLYKESRNFLELLARWGNLRLADRVVPDECWALRRGLRYEPPDLQPGLRCKHAPQVQGAGDYVCLPMMVEGGALGLLHVVFSDVSSETRDEDALFAQRMSEQLGLALANFRLREALRVEAMQDVLTGLCNRRFLEVALKREFDRAARDRSSVGVMMLDVDHFKRYNDLHGHDVGDVALRQLGKALMENCRAADLACRFGGEEFTVVCPATNDAAMRVTAERLLDSVRDMRPVANGKLLPKLTVSIGIASYPEHGETTAEVLRAADQALYAAKQAGRDRYMFSPGNPRDQVESANSGSPSTASVNDKDTRPGIETSPG